RKQLERGRMVTELMKQPQYQPLQVWEMALTLFAVNNGYFDDIEVKKALAAEKSMRDAMKGKYPGIVKSMEDKKDLSADEEKGLCGALNTNLLRLALGKYKEWEAQGEKMEVCAIGGKGFGFMQRLGASVVSHVVQIGDRPQMDRLIGAVKVMLDGYVEDRFDRLMLFYTRFINTMKQEPVMEQLLPLSGERLGSSASHWDYLYEPEAKAVLEQVLTRYIETIIFQAVSENMASEQSA